jgi:hypothetical protein
MQYPKPSYKRQRDKVQKIILQDTKECYLTHRTDGLALHHIFYGNGKRSLSDKYGLTVWLRHEWHTGLGGVHFNATLDKELKQMAQRAFEKVYGHNRFMELFGRSYL